MLFYCTPILGLLLVAQLSVLHYVTTENTLHGSRAYYDAKREDYGSAIDTALRATEELNRAINDPVSYGDIANTDHGHYEYGAYIQRYRDAAGNYKFRYTPPHTDMQATFVGFDPTPSGRQIVDTLMHKIADQNPNIELPAARAMAERSMHNAGLSMAAHYRVGRSGLMQREVVALVHGHPRAYDGPMTIDRFYDTSAGTLMEHARPLIVSANEFSKLDIDFARARRLDFYLAAPNGDTWLVNPKGKIYKVTKNISGK